MTPFNCSPFAYLFGPDVNQLDLVTGKVTYLSTLTTSTINAIGFNILDGYMYGYNSTTNKISKIGIDGDVQDLFSVPNLPNQVYNIADIDDNGYIYFTIGASLTYYVVDLNPARPTTYGNLVNPSTKALTTTGTSITGSVGGALIGTGDWAFSPIDSQLYYVKNNDGIVRRMDPSTGIVTQLTTNTAVTGQFGGIFFDPSGTLYASDNLSPNNIYKYTISGTTATRSVLSSISGGSGGGDGSRCKYAPVYFATLQNPPTKTASPYKNIDDIITYTIVINNIGNVTANNVTLIDTLPLGTTFINNSVTVNGTSISGSPAPPSGINLGNIAIGTSTIIFTATATSIPTPNPTPNNATFTYEFTDTSSGILYNRSAQTTTASTTIVDLSITSLKTVDLANAKLNDILTYTIVFSSTGNVSTTALTFIDTIPNGTTYVANSLKQDGTSISGSPSPPGVSLPNQLSGNTLSTVTFKVQITAIPVPNPITNTATLKYDYISDPLTPTIKTKGTTSNSVSTTLNDPLMSITKTVSKDFAQLNDTLTYTIVITNGGTVDATNLTFLDTLPSYVTFVANSFKINNITQPGTNPTSSSITLPNIVSNSKTTLTFDVLVSTLPNPNPISNSASISYEYTAISTIPNGANGSLNTNIVSTTVTQAILNISKLANPDPASLGTTVTYTLNVINTGNTSGLATIVDTIPSETSFIINSVRVNGVTQTGASILPPNGFNLGTVPSNSSVTVTFDVLVNSVPTNSILQNSASLSYKYTQYPTLPNGVNKAVLSNTISSGVINSSVSLKKFIDKNFSTCGTTLTYTLVIENTGNTSASNIILYDTLPSSLSFVLSSVQINNISLPSATPSLGIPIQSLLPGQITTVTFNAIVLCS